MSFPPEKNADKLNQVGYSTGAQEGQGHFANNNTNYAPPMVSGNNSGSTAAAYGYEYDYSVPGAPVGAAGYPGATSGTPAAFLDPNMPRPNDILPLHPAIIEQRQIAASLPPCPKGGYHELRTHQYDIPAPL